MRSVSAAEMRALDEKAVRDYGIPSLLLMENAGVACAREAAMLTGEKGSSVVVFAGKGNNGGDGFVAARHLHNWGHRPQVFFFQHVQEMKPDPGINFEILRNMKVSLVDCSANPDWAAIGQALRGARVVLDALFGTGLSKPVEGTFKRAIEIINGSRLPVVAVDIPSGLDADTGEVLGVCVAARVTVTLGLPKHGLSRGEGPSRSGKIVVADISLPRELIANIP